MGDALAGGVAGHHRVADADAARIAFQKIEARIRAKLANNGRNPENDNAGIRTGSDLHYCEILLDEIDRLRAILINAALAIGGDCREFREHIYDPETRHNDTTD